MAQLQTIGKLLQITANDFESRYISDFLSQN